MNNKNSIFVYDQKTELIKSLFNVSKNVDINENIIKNNNIWIFGGQDGKLAITTDAGKKFTNTSVNVDSISQILFNGYQYLMSGTILNPKPDDKTPLFVSEDGISWTKVTTDPEYKIISSICWVGYRWLVLANIESFYLYSDGTIENFPLNATSNSLTCWNGKTTFIYTNNTIYLDNIPCTSDFTSISCVTCFKNGFVIGGESPTNNIKFTSGNNIIDVHNFANYQIYSCTNNYDTFFVSIKNNLDVMKVSYTKDFIIWYFTSSEFTMNSIQWEGYSLFAIGDFLSEGNTYQLGIYTSLGEDWKFYPVSGVSNVTAACTGIVYPYKNIYNISPHSYQKCAYYSQDTDYLILTENDCMIVFTVAPTSGIAIPYAVTMPNKFYVLTNFSTVPISIYYNAPYKYTDNTLLETINIGQTIKITSSGTAWYVVESTI